MHFKFPAGTFMTILCSISRLMIMVFGLLGVAHAAEPSITDFWLGKASFKFTKSYTAAEMHNGHITNFGAGFTGGVRIKVVGSTWYLFMRRVETETSTPNYCPDHKLKLLSIVVSQSVDEGLHWSKPVRIIKPKEDSALECGVTDGDAYFNQEQNEWHFLFQCLSRKGWQGCYAKRKGSDPLGEFDVVVNNPVIPAGSLWSKVCDTKSEKCAGGIRKIMDEGTFDIFDFVDGYYFVDYHGFDGKYGYRSLIKTKDFANWEVVIHDSLLSKREALKFNTSWDKNGPIGFGAGRIIKDASYYYLISEASDKSLACTPGQRWVWGMFRSKTLLANEWERYSDNPFFTIDNFPVHDDSPLPCNPAYLGIFVSQGGGKTYLHASLPSKDAKLDGIYFYELVKK